MRGLTMTILILFAFAVPWEYTLDLGEPLGNVARILGVLALLTAIPALIQARSWRRPGALGWLVMALYLYFCLSCLWTVDPIATSDKIRAYFQVMMPVWLIWEFARTVQDLRWLMRAFVGGCWVLVLSTVLDFASADAIAAEQIRFVANGQDPNDVARFLDLGFPLAALLFATESRWPPRLAAISYLPAGLLAVLLTASRGGFSAAVVALGGSVLLLMAWKRRKAFLALSGIATVSTVVALFVPVGSLQRLMTIPEQLETSDLNNRFDIWVSGWHAFTTAPWFGSGAGAFVSAAHVAPTDTAHNTVVAVAVTGGLFAIAVTLGIVGATGRAVFLTTGLMRIAIATTLIVWVITSMVGSVEENRTTWLLFAIIALAGRLAVDDSSGLKRLFSAHPQSKAPPVSICAEV
jgi:O-antigen ligase